MTTITGVSSAGTTAATYYYTHPAERRIDQDPTARVAEVLGVPTDTLKQQLARGRSLDDVADEEGVSHDELISAIKQGLPAGAGAEVAERIASTSGGRPAGGPHTGGPHTGEPPAGGPKGTNAGLHDDGKLQQISRLLDMDTEDVTEKVTTASSLVGLLQTRNVDLAALRGVLNSGDLLDVAA